MINFLKFQYFKGKHEKGKMRRGSQRKVWKRKSENKCMAGFTCCRTDSVNSWYFDSGCSKHMTGDKDILSNLKY